MFSLLQQEIAATMKQSYPGMNPVAAEWKGQEITDFQEDLLIKVNGRLSEKWFYTHIKSSNPTLPRIDVLNLLSKYSGYSNWDDFKFKNPIAATPKSGTKTEDRVFIKIPLLLLFIMIVLLILFKLFNTQNYTFTFIDADTGEQIKNPNIQVDIYLRNESPVNYSCDQNGSLAIKTDQNKIKMVVRSPYYMADTVERILRKFNRNEQIRLHVDSYALMIRCFMQTDVKAWQKRREQLGKILGESALIYQVPDKNGESGMDLFNKQEFIDKLTMPASGLKQIEILDTKYDQGQIVLLRFRLNPEK